MALLGRLAGMFGPQIRSRGREYQRSGWVRITRHDDTSIRASVQGSRSYRVDIRWDDGEFQYRCNCPYGVEFDGPCKHVWATLLQADEQRLLPERFSSSETEPQIVDDEDVEDDEDDEDDGIYEFDEDDSHPLPDMLRDFNHRRDIGHGGIKRGSDLEKIGWKRQLARLRQDMEAATSAAAPLTWPEDRRLIYIVDLEAALEGDGLAVEIATETRKPDGSWDKPKPAKIARDLIDELPELADRHILQMLAGTRSDIGGFLGIGTFGDAFLPKRFTLPGSGYLTTLRAICNTGRARIRPLVEDDDELSTSNEIVPLTWDEGPPWEFWLEVGRSPGGRNYVLGGSLRRDEQKIPVDEADVLMRGGVAFVHGTVARFDHNGAFDLLAALRDDIKLTVPGEQGDDLLRALFSLPRLPKLDLPEELRVEEVSPTPRPRMKIRSPKKRSHNERLAAEVTFDYAGTLFSHHDPAVARYDTATRRVVRRDFRAEDPYIAKLLDLGVKSNNGWGEDSGLHLAANKLPKVVRELASSGWHVEAEGKLYRSPGEFKMSVKSGIDWFELHGEVDFGGLSAPLPKLLEALRKGEKFIALGDGTFGLLPEEWLAKYGAIAALGEAQDDHLQFSKKQVGFLDALLASMPETRFDETYARASEALRKFEGVQPQDPPNSFIGTLRPYQRDGLGWMAFLRQFGFGGCLADDMGLGKTVQVLALLEARRQEKKGPSLVVVPKSLVFNWKAEAGKFTPHIRVLDHTGVERERESGGHFENFDLILTTYGTLRRDAELFKDVKFDYLILDEAQAIKNASTGAAKAARLLRGEHRLALSGTPVQNHLGELWSLFEFLNPGMMGAASIFKMTPGGGAALDPDSRALLSRALRPFILRRTKEQVAKELPEKLEQTLFCEMDDAQRKLYDELRNHYRTSLMERVMREGINKSKIQVLEALLRLRQAACHPGLIDKSREKESSAKLDALVDQIGQVIEENHKVLVFSQFTSLLSIVKLRLNAHGISYEYLDGKTRDRESRVNRFQTDPDCKLFLISLKAGGLGLNLTAAEYVYLLDPWWNPAVEAQAIDRAHRIGQTQRVFAYRLIARDTVEEKVLALQQTKRDLADAIINADNSLIGRLGKEDLELLLS